MYSRYNNLINFFSLFLIIFVIIHYYACFWFYISQDKVQERFVFVDETIEPVWFQVSLTQSPIANSKLN